MSLILDGTAGLSDVDGSAATPAIRGTDANTGMFFPAADTIAFSEGGTEAMRIDSSANVGIGTTNPVGKLHIIQGLSNSVPAFAIGESSNITRFGIYQETSYEGIVLDSGNIDLKLKTATIAGSGGTMSFWTGTTTASERMRIPSAGGVQCVTTLSVGNATPAASGAGVTFPATQSASSDANTLDDYEEGTWTPTLVGNSTAGTYTFSTSQANYTKIGRQVTVNAYLVFGTASGGSGAAKFGGLPFTKANNVLTAGNLIASGLDFGAGTISLAIGSWTLSPSTEFYISESKDNASEVSMDIAGISTGDYVILSMTYFT